MGSTAISTIVGIIPFIIGIFVGVCLTLLTLVGYVEARAAMKEETEKAKTTQMN